jgi:type I restriction enzyme S subunit
MMKYQCYAEYKDSGVEWLGEIPSHWDSKPLKYLCTYNDEVLTEATSSDTEIQYIDIGSVSATEGISHIETMLFKDAPSRARRIVKDGDVIVSTVRTYLEAIAPIDNPPENLIVSTGFAVIRPNKNLYKGYAAYCLRAKGFIKEVVARSVGVSYPAINSSDLVNIAVPSIAYSEQTKIANFLDHETAKIDSLIEKQQQLIELLKEKRQAVISHAVTKGLNPNVSMKDSGVEWLGQVPEHWIVKSYRHASRIYRGKFGHRPRNDPAFYDGEYPFIQTGDVARADKYITEYSQTLNEKGKEVSQLFPKGTLMMAIAANIGDTAILGFEAYAPDSVVGFKPHDQIDLEFLKYSFMAALPALEQTSTQSTQANLNVERIGAVQGSFPSKGEQKKIVQYLDQLLEHYRVTENKAESTIQLMQERRTALISAAVTGKIDVRNWQNPNNNNEAKTEFSA